MKINNDGLDQNFINLLESLGGAETLQKMAMAMMKDPRIQKLYEDAMAENANADEPVVGPETLFEILKGINK
jgi:hypothetical protein